MPSEDKLFDRLGEIPVLNDSWTTAWGCYSKMKGYNSLTKFTFGVAESGVKKAAEISSPVVSHYQPQIDIANLYACTKLNELETKYPLMKQPSAEVKDACLEYAQPVVGRVKPVVTCVQGVVENGKRKVNHIKTTGTNLAVGARDLSLGTMTFALTKTLDTSPGRFVTRTVDGAITIADGLVEKYIPEEKKEDSDEEQDDDEDGLHVAHDNGAEVLEMDVMEPSPERVVVHFRNVSKKLRSRMFRRAMRDFQRTKTQTSEALQNLNKTVDLIAFAQTTLGTARNKVEDIWDKVMTESTVEKENTQASSLHAGTLEERIVTLGQMLTRQVRSGIAVLEKTSMEVGQIMRHPISKSTEYKNLIKEFNYVRSLQDLTSVSVEGIRSNVAYVQKRLRELIDNVESSQWTTVDIEMTNVELESEDLMNSAIEISSAQETAATEEAQSSNDLL